MLNLKLALNERDTSMPSFDIVSKIDNTAVENALAGVTKEMQVRYDSKEVHVKCRVPMRPF